MLIEEGKELRERLGNENRISLAAVWKQVMVAPIHSSENLVCEAEQNVVAAKIAGNRDRMWKSILPAEDSLSDVVVTVVKAEEYLDEAVALARDGKHLLVGLQTAIRGEKKVTVVIW